MYRYVYVHVYVYFYISTSLSPHNIYMNCTSMPLTLMSICHKRVANSRLFVLVVAIAPSLSILLLAAITSVCTCARKFVSTWGWLCLVASATYAIAAVISAW